MGTTMITRVKGTQDFLDMTLYNFLVNKLTQHVELHNFTQIQTPIIEQTKLFKHNLGDASEVVTKQMYIFETESGDSICLRPEPTASAVRAFIENKVTTTPWKIYSCGPVFRHERPQKGRWRQFTQFDIEMIGTQHLFHDAQFIKMLDYFFDEKLNLENYVLKLNFLGIKQDRDKHREALVAFLNQHASTICPTCLIRKDKNPLRVFDCKNEECKKVYEDAPVITDYLCDKSKQEWQELNTLLDKLSVSRIHDPKLVRGLDYYNKTVFEFSSSTLGAQDAFAGGGRYSLGKNIGAKEDIPSFGVGVGIGRLMLLLETMQDSLALPSKPRLHALLPLGPEQKDLACMLAHALHQNNLCADVIAPNKNMGKMMKKANSMGAAVALIIGEDERANNTVTVKNMTSGDQKSVRQDHLIEFLKK